MKMHGWIMRAEAAALAGIILCSAISCGKNNSSLQLLEEDEPEPQYLSFFAGNNYTESDLGKYWSDRFGELYNQQVYVNYDRAAYYAEEGLSYRELLEKRLEST